jgi:chromate transporter
MDNIVTDAEVEARHSPSRAEAFMVWLRIGLLSFGGPAAQIALMHREIVDKKQWLSERQYLNALSFCMLLPGPEAMQLATYVGWRLHGTIGGLIAGLLFVLPGAIVVFALAAIYAVYGEVSLVATFFIGVKAAVIIVVVEALIKVSKRALHLPEH